jgi:hypothetical protein
VKKNLLDLRDNLRHDFASVGHDMDTIHLNIDDIDKAVMKIEKEVYDEIQGKELKVLSEEIEEIFQKIDELKHGDDGVRKTKSQVDKVMKDMGENGPVRESLRRDLRVELGEALHREFKEGEFAELHSNIHDTMKNIHKEVADEQSMIKNEWGEKYSHVKKHLENQSQEIADLTRGFEAEVRRISRLKVRR